MPPTRWFRRVPAPRGSIDPHPRAHDTRAHLSDLGAAHDTTPTTVIFTEAL